MAALRAFWMPPRSSVGAGCDGPPKSVLLSDVTSQVTLKELKKSLLHLQAKELHKFQLRVSSLVAEVCPGISNAVINP